MIESLAFPSPIASFNCRRISAPLSFLPFLALKLRPEELNSALAILLYSICICLGPGIEDTTNQIADSPQGLR